MRTTAFVAVALAAVAAGAAARSPSMYAPPGMPQEDLITALPGFNGTFPSQQFSGYLTVDAAHGRVLHYWAFLSENDPSTDPVVVNYNGGPGCSSMDSLFYEQGPLHFVNPEQGTGVPELTINPNRWSMNTTLIFIESPAGVGFSYSNTSSDYATNDNITAADSLESLVQFFTVKFPSLATNDFYIWGESYAGIYVPTLAYAVLEHNSAASGVHINLKGIMVGNGCIGNSVGACSAAGTQIGVNFTYGHGLYSEELYNKIYATCEDFENPSISCYALLSEMSTQIGRINVYDVYTQCIQGGSAADSKHSRGRRIPRRLIDEIFEPEGPVGCIDGIAAGQYLNQPAVREAIHVAPASLIGEWTICTNKIQYDSNTVDETKSIYPTLIKSLRVLIYNGDVDACVPYVGNEQWTSKMGFPVKSGWHSWTVPSDFGPQVGGYATVYDVTAPGEFSFITVHDSGHMVPEYQPEKALAMFNRYMAGESF